MRGLVFLFMVSILAACTSPGQEELYGSWKYIRVENPEQGPSGFTSEEELKENDPSVIFRSDGRMEMIWGGKTLSHGTFKLEYPTIAYKEQMQGGKVRDIRFLIKKFEKDELVFQTQEADPVRVTARRINTKP